MVLADIFIKIVDGKERSDLGENVFPCIHCALRPNVPDFNQKQFKSFEPQNELKPLSINTFKELYY